MKELLGPGIYGELRQPIANRKPGDSKAPFTSTKARFDILEDTKPGPGAYNSLNMIEKLVKKP